MIGGHKAEATGLDLRTNTDAEVNSSLSNDVDSSGACLVNALCERKSNKTVRD